MLADLDKAWLFAQFQLLEDLEGQLDYLWRYLEFKISRGAINMSVGRDIQIINVRVLELRLFFLNFYSRLSYSAN